MLNRAHRFPLLALLLLAITCGGLDTFDVEQSSRASLPGKSPLEQLLSGAMPFGDEFTAIDISQSQELENQGVDKSDIDSVRLSNLTLTLESPAEQDFSFLQSIAFYVEADGLERRLIAEGGPFEPGLRKVGLDVTDVDLAPYAVKDFMRVTTEVSGERPDADSVVRADLVLSVDANVSGLVCGG